jgi:hypothetical protein
LFRTRMPMLRRQDLLWWAVFLLGGKVGIWKQARELVIMSEPKSTGHPPHSACRQSYQRWYSLGVDAYLITFPFKPNVPWTTHQRRKKIDKNWKLLSRRQQSSNWGRGLHPATPYDLHHSRANNETHTITQNATYESRTK